MKDFKNIRESVKKTAVISYGRFNPPTIGHQKLIEKVVQTAKSNMADPFVFLSGTSDKKKNPLQFDEKLDLAKKIFSNYNVFSLSDQKPSTILHAASLIHSNGYKNILVVVGSDRVAQFDKLVKEYNGVDGKPHGYYNFESIKVVSAGNRDPDADDVSGMSGSKMREFVQKGDFESFKQGVPDTINEDEKRKMYQLLRQRMNLSIIEEKYITKSGKAKGSKDSNENSVPDKYEKGLSDKTVLQRKRLWKKLRNKKELDPSDYKNHPGDEDKSSVESKYTKKYRAKFKEQLIMDGNKTKNLCEEAYLIFNDIKNSQYLMQEKSYIDKSIEYCDNFHEIYYDIVEQKFYKNQQLNNLLELQTKINNLFKLVEESSGMIEFRADKLDFLQSMVEQVSSMQTQSEYVSRPLSDELIKYLSIDESKKALQKKASESGVAYGTLKKVYDRGMKAWATGGHRPGTTPQQWALARVNSYITKGKTYHTADKDLREVYEDGTNEYADYVKRITPGQENAELRQSDIKAKIIKFLKSKKNENL